jgi:hypothetical protein
VNGVGTADGTGGGNFTYLLSLRIRINLSPLIPIERLPHVVEYVAWQILFLQFIAHPFEAIKSPEYRLTVNAHAPIFVRDGIVAYEFIIFDDMSLSISVDKFFRHFPPVHFATMTANVQYAVRKMLGSKIEVSKGCVFTDQQSQIVMIPSEEIDQPRGFFVLKENR